MIPNPILVEVPCFYCNHANLIDPDDYGDDQFALATICEDCGRGFSFDLDVKYVVTSYDSGWQ